MKTKITKIQIDWTEIKNECRHTTNKEDTKVPATKEFIKKVLISEHSPIRLGKIKWSWDGIKSWISVHFARHWLGWDKWVSTQRTDRTGVTGINRDDLPQGSLVNHACEADAQSLINISRKRLCTCASIGTREAWQAVKNEVAKTEPELASCMVKECIYRGFCPEMFSCGYHKTEAFQKELKEYREGINE